MKRKLKPITILFIAFLLTACSAEQRGTKDTLAIELPSPTSASITQPSLPAATDEHEQTDPEAINPASSPVAGEEVQAAKLYKMDKVYRFKPIDKTVSDKVVLLTFDDGPKDKTVLTSILDTLDKHQAKAIFFVNGYRIKQNPELLKLINERGQTIGNHSFDHIDLKKETKEVVEKQIVDVQNEVESIVGIKPLFFRPPYGSGGETVKEAAKNHGMLFMTWSNGSLDWDKSAKNKPDVVIKNVLEQLHPGANILMHEVQWTADALGELLSSLEDKGYGFIDPAVIALDL